MAADEDVRNERRAWLGLIALLWAVLLVGGLVHGVPDTGATAAGTDPAPAAADDCSR